MTLDPDPLTVLENEPQRIYFDEWVARNAPPPRLAVDAGWLLVVAIVAAIAGVIVGRVTG